MIRRRSILGAGAGLLAGAAGPAPSPTVLAQPAPAPLTPPPAVPVQPTTALDLLPMRLPVKLDDQIANGYRRDVLISWGDRVAFDAPRWSPRAPDEDAAAGQFGWDARMIGVMALRPAGDGVPRLLAAVGHPTVDPAMAFPGGTDLPAVALTMQGASLLNLERQGGRWVVVDGGFQTRRITGQTLCRITGPARSVLGESVRGLLGVGGGCVTPWNSLLLAEDDPASWLPRLRVYDGRFTDGAPYGWVAELDPLEPMAVPAKRTALGRMAHGDAAATVSRDGRAVVYLTDRRPFGFLFRFLSTGPATAADALDSGTLAVARLEPGGTSLAWRGLPATTETLLNPVAAAELAGGTLFDLPGGLALSPRGMLYLACGGNAARLPAQVDALNPRAGSRAGHVIEITPAGGDHGGDTAAAEILFLGGDPALGGRYGGLRQGMVNAWPTVPTTLACDPRGRLWIGTDHGGVVDNAADALYGCETQGPSRGLTLPIYGAPRAAGIGCCAVTPDGGALLTIARAPGAEPGASYARPGTRWPAFQPQVPPRTTMVILTRAAGGMVGG